jgi:hypothetical protein
LTPRPRWEGRTVVCIASGPSLTVEDCARAEAAGHPVVVTNTTFRLCPRAAALYAFDLRWWKVYHEEVKANFSGRRFSASTVAANYGAEPTFGATWFRGFRNSGASAVSLAIGAGAARVIMLGFDAGFQDGRKHWHGDHPDGLGNADTVGDWARQFEMVAKYAARAGVEIVNASRRTRLACFPRAELEASL